MHKMEEMNARVNKASQKAAMISNVQVLIKFDTVGAVVQMFSVLIYRP